MPTPDLYTNTAPPLSVPPTARGLPSSTHPPPATHYPPPTHRPPPTILQVREKPLWLRLAAGSRGHWQRLLADDDVAFEMRVSAMPSIHLPTALVYHVCGECSRLDLPGSVAALRCGTNHISSHRGATMAQARSATLSGASLLWSERFEGSGILSTPHPFEAFVARLGLSSPLSSLVRSTHSPALR